MVAQQANKLPINGEFPQKITSVVFYLSVYPKEEKPHGTWTPWELERSLKKLFALLG